MEPTRFFEAHGTGTLVGDPNECKAMGSAFRQSRSTQDPLWVGALKSNIGHLEGASGFAGVIKAMLVLKAVIPPNTNFEKLNTKIDTEFLRIQGCYPIKGLRRASVHSFGNAGTNAHVILDDVYHFLAERNLDGLHITVRDPPSTASFKPLVPLFEGQGNSNGYLAHDETSKPKLLMFSSYDGSGIKRPAKSFAEYFSNIDIPSSDWKTYLRDMAFTLSHHRSSLPLKSSAVVISQYDLFNLEKIVSTPTKSITDPRLDFIFIGQRVQWA